MRPWMRFLPRRVRHLIICKWKGGYHDFCVGHSGVNYVNPAATRAAFRPDPERYPSTDPLARISKQTDS